MFSPNFKWLALRPYWMYHHKWEPFYQLNGSYDHVPKWMVWRFRLIWPFIRGKYR